MKVTDSELLLRLVDGTVLLLVEDGSVASWRLVFGQTVALRASERVNAL